MTPADPKLTKYLFLNREKIEYADFLFQSSLYPCPTFKLFVHTLPLASFVEEHCVTLVAEAVAAVEAVVATKRSLRFVSVAYLVTTKVTLMA